MPQKTINHKTISSIKERALAAIAIVGFAAGTVAVKVFNPVTAGFFPQCPFHSLTGWNCPGCGATRGMHALLNGDVLGALHYNALLIVLVPLMLFGFASVLLKAVRGRGIEFPRFAPQAILVLAIVMIVFAVVRNLPFYPFSLLAI